jgi:peroxiredoxin family protein
MATITDNSLTLAQLSEQLAKLQGEVEQIRNDALPKDKLSMIVFSGDLDKLLASFIIATGAAAMFDEVVMFFTFWGTMALRDPKKSKKGKDIISAMFGRMLPKGAGALTLSKMHMGGAGTGMMKGLMKKKNVLSLEELIKTAADSGVKIFVCEMSLDLMGFSLDEMIDYPGIKLAGVATFLQEAATSKSTLFI